MKKLTKILAVLLACITVFSTVSMAADGTATEEVTTAVQEETTTAVEEETTTSVQEETTTSAQEETTTEKVEETTTEAQEETTTEPTTVPETTTEAAEEITTATDETTTTTPEVTDPTEPDETEPTDPDVTDPTDPTQPEVTAPAVPESFGGLVIEGALANLYWYQAGEVTGFTIYRYTDEQWQAIADVEDSMYEVKDQLFNSVYKYAVKSYVEADGVRYYCEGQAETTVETNTKVYRPAIITKSLRNGVKIDWEPIPGVTGYRVYIKNGSEWKQLTEITGYENHIYVYEDVEAGKQYRFAVRAYAKGTKGTKWSERSEEPYVHKDVTKTKITSKSATSSSVTLKWQEVEDAAGYRVYVYKGGKWKYYKGIKTESYTVKSLEDATKYKFKVRSYFKEDGKTIWGGYSDEVSVTTKGKTVKSYRVGKLKKYFTDGDWSVKVAGLKDEDYGTFDYTIAMKGNKAFVRYDFKNNKLVRDFEYLIDIDKDKIYIIFDDDKTYAEIKGDEAYVIAFNTGALAGTLDMSTAKNVTAKTTTYSDKKAVAEIYTDKQRDIKKTYYFINDKVKALKITYSDGSTETLKISKINDTPSSSVFKLPSNYKQIKY